EAEVIDRTILEGRSQAHIAFLCPLQRLCAPSGKRNASGDSAREGLYSSRVVQKVVTEERSVTRIDVYAPRFLVIPGGIEELVVLILGRVTGCEAGVGCAANVTTGIKDVLKHMARNGVPGGFRNHV